MFSRGKATSGAPICSGMIQLAKPVKRGMANISSMIEPCIVNAWLNCSFDMICSPGRASSARISSAITPPTMKNANAVTRYSVPIFLWSVVVTHSTHDGRGDRPAGRPVTATSAVGPTAPTLCICASSTGRCPPRRFRARRCMSRRFMARANQEGPCPRKVARLAPVRRHMIVGGVRGRTGPNSP